MPCEDDVELAAVGQAVVLPVEGEYDQDRLVLLSAVDDETEEVVAVVLPEVEGTLVTAVVDESEADEESEVSEAVVVIDELLVKKVPVVDEAGE